MDAYVRCPECGEIYRVNINEPIDEIEDRELHCDACGHDIQIPFFLYCPNCEEYVSVDQGKTSEALLEIGVNMVKGFFSPWSTIPKLTRFIDSVPSANGWGVCRICGTHYVRCHKCNSAVEVRPGTGDDDILYCSECGSRMRQP